MGKESTVNNKGIHHTFFFKKSELKCKASLKVFFAYARNAVLCKQKLEESNTEAKESSLASFQ